MKNITTLVLTFTISVAFAQEKDKALQKSNDYVYEGNVLIDNDFVAAEKEYRKAISKKPNNTSGTYNLGNAYYNSKHYSEALLRHIEASKTATTKAEKHLAHHNIGNALMQQKQCKEAVEAFKNALRNDPTDEESRYNLALAKECAEQQGDGGGGDDDKKDEDKKEENKEKDDKKDQDQDKKEGDDKKDEEGKPKDEKDDKQNGDPKNEKKEQQPQQGKLSPQQVKNLLEAMNNQEKNVQDKINAKKVKGEKAETEKDW